MPCPAKFSDGKEEPIIKLLRHQARNALTLCAALAGAPLILGVLPTTEVCAQSAVKLSKQQLDSLTAPIALYPDALLAQVLMAATFPRDQAAADWSKENIADERRRGGEGSRVEAVGSERAVARRVSASPRDHGIEAGMGEPVGDAFLAQPNDVMNSVQGLRKQAQQAGNLKSNEQQKVIVEQDTIEIQPANPQVVYVPTYNPTVVYGAWLYPAYPPMYIPPPPGYALASGFDDRPRLRRRYCGNERTVGRCDWTAVTSTSTSTAITTLT